MSKQLRFGDMCRESHLAKWQADSIQKLIDEQSAKLSLVIYDARPSESYMDKYLKLRNLLWTAFMFLKRKKFRATQKIDCSAWFDVVETMNCQVIKKGKFSEYFNEKDIDKIESVELDFILRFSFGIIRGRVLTVAKYGVWSFHHGDERAFRGGPPGFWEIYKNDKVTGAILQRLTHKLDGGIILKRGFFRTKYNYVKNRDQMYLESSRWPAQMVVDIKNGKTDMMFSAPTKTDAPIYKLPSNWKMLLYILRCSYFRIAQLLEAFFFVDYWNVGLSKEPISAFLEGKKPPVEWFPLDSYELFLADPFGHTIDKSTGRFEIFIETFEFKNNKGHIDCLTYDGTLSKRTKIIDEEYHLSFPFVIEAGNNMYMIPESNESNGVFLYKAKDYPLKWVKEKCILESFRGVDPAVHHQDGKYWMFISDKEDGVHFNLNIFFADHVEGSWHPHAKNPVKTDIRSARSAGNLFEHQGSLYRPSMDYSEKIEGRVRINKVNILSEHDFEEEEVTIVDPYHGELYGDKIHTLSAVGDYVLIDGARALPIWKSKKIFYHKLTELKRRITR